MICPNCNKEIPDDILACSECGAEIDTDKNLDKDKIKEYTHYKVILISPGPRDEIIEFISEITNLPVNEIKKNLSNLPLIIESRIPLNKAQELKVLLETKVNISYILLCHFHRLLLEDVPKQISIFNIAKAMFYKYLRAIH